MGTYVIPGEGRIEQSVEQISPSPISRFPSIVLLALRNGQRGIGQISRWQGRKYRERLGI
jgi:hypothetical protein